MAIHTTTIGLSSAAAVALISSNTSWADIKGAHNQDPVPFSIHNSSTLQQIRWGGAGLSSANVASGFPLLPAQTQSFSLLRSDAVFAMTTASEVTVNVVAGRQTGGNVSSAA